MSQQSPDLTGRKIGEYEVISRIGVGGMGVVYEGRQPLIGKRVAVKVLLPQLSSEHDLVERFLAEARSVNEIRHRGIVDIFSFGQLPEGSHYFVMEYLEGEGFDTIIKARAPVPMTDALGWVGEVLDALGAAHSAGIIHRDIKPSNLFLVNTGRGKPYVKLLDFGIAKLGVLPGGEATPQTRASVIMGTPDYISPEQAKGKPISPQTDLYAVGCVLFELVTGFRVFRGENTLQTMWSHVEDQPPVPSSIVPSVPPELDELILWALEKDATNRPPSAQVMAEHLESIRSRVATGPLTPLPMGAGARGASARTPPPSVRARVLSSTPALAQPTLKTPTARSGGPQPLRTPAPRSNTGGLRGDTRLSPLTVDEAGPVLPETRAAPVHRPAPEPAVASEVDVPVMTDEVELPAPQKSRTPLVLVLLALLVVIGGAGAFLLAPSLGAAPQVTVEKTGDDVRRPMKEPAKPADPPVAAPTAEVKPPEPAEEKPPEPVGVKPAEPPAVKPPEPAVVKPPEPAVVKPPEPPVSVKPAEVKKNPGITTAQLEGRLAKLEQKLAAREAQTGEKDRVLRQLFDQAKKDIASATTEADRREAAQELVEIAGQFPK